MEEKSSGSRTGIEAREWARERGRADDIWSSCTAEGREGKSHAGYVSSLRDACWWSCNSGGGEAGNEGGEDASGNGDVMRGLAHSDSLLAVEGRGGSS